MTDKKDPSLDSAAATRPPTPGNQPAPEARSAEGRLSLEVRTRPGIAAVHVPMTGGRLIIGREEGDVRIEDLLVSRQHATIEMEDGRPVIRDLDSTNGTFLNGELLLAPAPLRDGDDIRIGPSHLLVRISRD